MNTRHFSVLMTCLALAVFSWPAFSEDRSGVFGAGGYSVVPFDVSTPDVYSLAFLSGWYDANMALFDAKGNHIIASDDVGANLHDLRPHITRVLDAGSYTLLIGHYAENFLSGERDLVDYLFGMNATFANSDGFTPGFYLVGGEGTLNGAMSFLAGYGDSYADSANFQLSISVAQVPEPEMSTMLLAGLGIMAPLIVSRRRRVSIDSTPLA